MQLGARGDKAPLKKNRTLLTKSDHLALKLW